MAAEANPKEPGKYDRPWRAAMAKGPKSMDEFINGELQQRTDSEIIASP